MTVNLQRPLIIGGGLLALSIGALDVLHHLVGEWGIYAVFALLGAAGVQWLHQQADRKLTPLQMPLSVDSGTVKRTLAEVEDVITQLEAEVKNPVEPVPGETAKPRVSALQSQMSQLAIDLNRDEIRVAVMGAMGSGKTVLLQRLQSAWADASTRLQFNELPGFSAMTTAGLTAEAIALQQTMTADLVLFVVTGDITESELQTVKQVVASKRTVLVFNKLDHYLPTDRQSIMEQLQMRVKGLLPATDVVAIAADPTPIKVRQHQADGSVNEWMEAQAPNIIYLIQRLEQILALEREQLVLTSSLNHAVALKQQAKTVLKDVRRARALPMIEQFQWVAAGTAFVSPIPTLDVLATAAINAQMILDLGTLYRQKFSLQQAQKMAATLGGLMLKLGLVELSTQAIAGLLKVNALTYVAGGCIQGVSAAYLTRIAGLSLVEYFHAQDPHLTMTEASPLAIERLSEILQSVFQKNQQLTFLQTFVGQAMDRLVALTPQPPQLTTVTLETPSEPLQIPLKSASALSERQEVRLLDENGSNVCLSVSSLDSTSLPSK